MNIFFCLFACAFNTLMSIGLLWISTINCEASHENGTRNQSDKESGYVRWQSCFSSSSVQSYSYVKHRSRSAFYGANRLHTEAESERVREREQGGIYTDVCFNCNYAKIMQYYMV